MAPPRPLYVPDVTETAPPSHPWRRRIAALGCLAVALGLAWTAFPTLQPLTGGDRPVDGALPGVLVGWDACTPMRLLLDPAAPAWLAKATRDAATDWSTATGLDITVRPDTRGHTWTGVRLDPAPVTGTVPVVLAADGTDPRLSGDQVAFAAPTGMNHTITGGYLVIGPQLANPDATPAQARVLARGIIRHELGHVLGLAHSDTPLMRAEPDIDAPISPADLAVVTALTRPCRS